MRLERFKVSNFRSLKSTKWISLRNSLTVIGPNNEGKSNLVKAMVAALQLLEELTLGQSRVPIFNSRFRRTSQVYNWTRDCPLDLQEKETTETEFKLEFSLNQDDIRDFYQHIGSTINNKLPITVTIGRNGTPRFEVNKPGKGYATLSAKSPKIAAFIGSKLSINYIPAVRTARDSARSVEGLVSSALRKVERSLEYQSAMRTIQDLQRPVIEDLEQKIGITLCKFLPNVKAVNIDLERGRNEAMRSVTISIDDGQLTSLSSKGDGVISLVGMALLARLDAFASSDISMILVIEEPESHLHPRAIHTIRTILDGLGSELQVVITTHSPSLVNRIDLSANILVENNKANVVSSISEVRDALGVRVSDNLNNSRLVVICEGKSDEAALKRILSEIDPRLETAFNTGEVAISTLDGSGNLSYMANALQNSICEPLCFLDDDNAGRQALQKAVEDSVLNEADFVLSKRIGKSESEFEDLISDDIVFEFINRKYKADMSAIPSGFRSKKFSDRAKAAFDQAGRPWNENVKSELKSELSRKCVEMGVSAIGSDKIGPLNSLAALISERLK
jgi:putative ATP-dependent endonuclease of OLD family